MQTAIEAYVAKVQQLNDEMHAKHYPNVPVPQVTAEHGRRYFRIVLSDQRGTSRSVHSFVDAVTGDILKAASWKAPAKGVRGNVNDLSRGFNAYGANYR
jgi:hypothetical protein